MKIVTRTFVPVRQLESMKFSSQQIFTTNQLRSTRNIWPTDRVSMNTHKLLIGCKATKLLHPKLDKPIRIS